MSGHQNFDEFFDLVGKMRAAQKKFFLQKTSDTLTQAKHYEKAVDDFLKTAAVKQEDSRQQHLF